MVKKILLSLLIFIVALEVLLRITGMYRTSNERSSGHYYSRYYRKMDTWFHHWTPGKTVDYKTTEFHYQNKYNELGHRETLFSGFKNDTQSVKVICLGDSFTEGDGAPADSTWVKRLEQLVRTEYDPAYRFYNAGVCGSDIFFNSRMLEHKLLQAKPRLVVECLNTSDLADVIWNGGEERFNADSTTSGKVGPAWEFFYRFSYIFRAVARTVLRYDENLMNKATLISDQQKAAAIIANRAKQTAQLCRENNIDYRLVVHTCPYENNDTFPKARLFLNALKDDDFVVNVVDTMMNFYLGKNINTYSYPVNGHYNSTGYFIMGNLVFDRLKQQAVFKKAL